MALRGFWQWIFGTVHFSAQGGDIARFLDLCAAQGISLSRLKANPLGLTGQVPARQYRRMHAPARRCRCRLRVCRRWGFCFLASPLRGRWGIVSGTVAFFVLCSILQGNIWTISYYNMSADTAAKLSGELANCGLVRGARPTKEGLEQVRQQVLLIDENLASLSFQFVKGRLLVEAIAIEHKPSIRDNTTPMDIVASKEGILEQLQVYSGYAVRSVGQSVAAGDVIVSHSYTDPTTGVTTTGQAHAQVLARTETVFSCQQPFSFVQTVPTGQLSVQYFLCMGQAKLPLFINGNTTQADYTELLPLVPFGWNLPFYLERHTTTQTKETQITLTREEAQARAELACAEQIARQMEGAEILSRQTQTTWQDDAVTCMVTVQAIEEIGLQTEPAPGAVTAPAPQQPQT
ncbi:MAG: sporulation protein YqfD [Pygmaiobacter massiliensis]|nr:sporulation protein YqfD [Pygmaiobacter massiliensis]